MTTIARRPQSQHQPGSAGAAFARRWARIYTAGLPAETQRARRAEIESDLFEHERDALLEGRPAYETGVSVFSRAIRGILADILWRFQVEGPKVQINIRSERLVGALVLALVVMLIAVVMQNGLDASRDGFADQLLRVGKQDSWEHNMSVGFQALGGAGLVLAAGLFYASLRERAPTLSACAGFALAAAGVLGLACMAVNNSFFSLAREYYDTGDAGMVPTARALAVASQGLTMASGLTVIGATYLLATLFHREKLAPRWMLWLAIASGISALVAVAGGGFQDDFGWIFGMLALILALIWLLFAGFYLVLGGVGRGRAGTVLAPASTSTA